MMAGSQKEASSSADGKQKTPLLDEGIGKEFLSSWKSMSVAEGDPMDFNFETGAKGKKTAFNFSKMDMDFNIDGDFGKISSFKVDMSDLDFSPKKTRKSKEGSGEDSVNRNHQGKPDNFTFSFDFNDFNFEPSLTKAENKSSKGVPADKSMCQDTRNPMVEDIDAFDAGIAMKLPAFEMATTLKADTLVGSPRNPDYKNDNGSSETANFENRSLSDEARTYEKKALFSTEETNKQSHSSEKTNSADPHDHQRILDIPVQSVYENESHGTVSELKTKNFSQDPKVNDISGGEQIVNAKMIAESGANHECSQFDNSSPLHITTSQSNDSERNTLDCVYHVPSENIDGTQPERCDFEDIVSRKALHDTKAGSENKNSASELHFTPLSSGQMLDKLMPLKEKGTGAIRSKYFRRTEETSQLHQASLTQEKVLSLGSKRVGAVHLIPADERREEFYANHATIGENLVDSSSSQTTKLSKGEPVFMGSEKNVQDVTTTKDDLDADRSQTRISKLVSTSMPHVQEVTRSETVLLGSERTVKDLNTFSIQVDLPSSIKQVAKSSTQKSVNPKPVVPNMESIQKLKTISVERNKLPKLKALTRTFKPSSLKISRDTGVSNILSNSTFGKEITSLRKSEQNKEVQGKAATKMVPSVETQKKMSPTSSLKRKTLEASNANACTLNPLKRLSESPSESRNLKEASEVVLKDQVCNQENLVDMNSKNVLNSVLDIPREVDICELDIPLVMENDLNVKMAEAYTKDLEDICNMLKKKHEEAKEILVRAIVNNNNLLMANHPMYEAKIRAIQNFAERIMSKKLQV